jgi:nucleotide-binding universal stress UspA family protein
MMTLPYPFTRILIPYDGSPSAKKGLEWAAHLAYAGGEDVEQVTLLRVIGGAYLARHIQNVDLRVTRMDQVAAWRRVRQHHLDHDILPLLEEGKRSLQEKGVAAPIETLVAEGKVGEEIIRVAEEGGYTTIVIGRRGLSPIKGLLLGSVTRQVLSLAQKMTFSWWTRKQPSTLTAPFLGCCWRWTARSRAWRRSAKGRHWLEERKPVNTI